MAVGAESREDPRP